MSEVETLRIRPPVGRLSSVIAVLCGLFTIGNVIDGLPVATVMVGTCGVMCTAVALFHRRCSTGSNVGWLVTATLIGIAGGCWDSGGPTRIDAGFLVLPPTLASIIGGRRAGVAAMFASAATYLVMMGLVAYGIEPVRRVPPERELFHDSMVALGLVVSGWLTTGYFVRAGERTLALAARERASALRSQLELQAVLRGVDVAVAEVDRSGRLLGPASGSFTAWFGEATPGLPLWERLRSRSTELGGFAEAVWPEVEAGWMPSELVFAQLPDRFQIGARVLDVRFRPVGDGEGDRHLFLATDVSASERVVELESEQQELLDVFLNLSEHPQTAGLFLAEASEQVGQLVRESMEPADQLRTLHTIKGSCNLMGLQSFARLAHRFEGRVQGGAALSAADRSEIEQAWTHVRHRLEPLMQGVRRDTLVLSRAALERLTRLARTAGASEDLLFALEGCTWEPVAPQLEHLAMHARGLARRLGKPGTVVEVSVDPHLTVPPRAGWSRFWSASVHAINNALDHGIETAEERRAAGKSGHGRVRLEAWREGAHITVVFEDDGRGIDWETLRARALERGLPASTTQDLVEAMFETGLSSRSVPSEISGRGVGAGALRLACEDLGGTLRVRSTPGEGTRFELSITLRAPMEPPEGPARGASTVYLRRQDDPRHQDDATPRSSEAQGGSGPSSMRSSSRR